MRENFNFDENNESSLPENEIAPENTAPENLSEEISPELNKAAPQSDMPPRRSFFQIVDDDEVEKINELTDGETFAGEGDKIPDTSKESGGSKSQKPRKKRRHKKRGCLWNAIWISIIGIFAVGIAAVIIMVFLDILALNRGSTPVQIEIPEGSSTAEIAEILKEAELIDFPLAFRLYSKLKGIDGTLRYGGYLVEPSLGYDGIADKLQNEGAQTGSVKITIKEGMNLKQIMALFNEEVELEGETVRLCSTTNFLAAMNEDDFDYKFLKDIPRNKVYYILEGYLFPDTYQFYPNDSVAGAKYMINTMLKNFEKRLPENAYSRAKQAGFNINEIVTLASIIEMEASGFDEEMKNVSAIFINRYHWTTEPKMLGSTPTGKYYGGSLYNTNKIEGLPPGPLCSPSAAAINAALNPTSGFAYYYFVTDSDKKFYYNKTLKEHDSTIAELKRKNKWTY